MSISNVKVKSSEVVGDTFRINHNFGSGYTLKIIQIDPNTNEKVLLEIEAAQGRSVRLQANISDNLIEL